MSEVQNQTKSFKKIKQRKLFDYIFYADKLKNFKIIMTPKVVIFILGVLISIHVFIAGALLIADKVIDQTVRYDNISECDIGFNEPQYGKICEVSIKIKADMKLPVYVYYELTHFYQNHYTYKSSISIKQQQGKVQADYPECGDTERAQGKIVYPCGLLPTSVFSDQIIAKLKTPKGSIDLAQGGSFGNTDSNAPTWRKEGIAWDVDEELVANVDFGDESINGTFTRIGPEEEKINSQMQGADKLLPLPEDADLLVWQRTAAWHSFRKIYRKIEKLPDGWGQFLRRGDELVFGVKNFFRVDGAKQTKSISIATKAAVGVNGVALYVLLSVSGVCCLLALAAVLINCLVFPRKFGDVTRLN